METNESPLPPQWSAPLIAAVLTLAGRMRRAAKRHLGSHRPGTPIPRPAIAAVAKEWHAAVDQLAPEIAGHLDTTLDGRAIPADPTAPDLLAGYREAIDRAATEQWPSPEAVMARGAMIARGEPRLLELAILHAHGDATGAGLHREAMPGACRRCAALAGDYPPPVPVDAYWTHCNCFCVFTIVDAPDDPGDGGPMAATESAPKYEHGSTQLDLPPYLADKVRAVGASIPDDHLAADGREQDPHATVAYGLTDTSDAAIGKVRAAAAGHPPVKLTLGKTSIFAGKDNGKPYDVVKADLHAPGMRTLRAAVRAATPVKDSQGSYQPHVTIAYVRAGLGRHYVDRSDLEGQSITLHRLVHSDRQGKKTIHPLKGASRTATEPSRFGEAGYPDGHWYTIHGAHVFISGGGGLGGGGAAEHAYAGHDGVITKGPAGMLGQSVAGLRANGHQIDRHLNGAMPAGADVGAHTLDGHAVDFQRQAHDIGKLAIAHAEAYNAGHAALKRDPNAIKTANEAYKHDLNNLPAHQRDALHQAYDQAQLSHGLTDLRETPKKLDQYGINARDRRAVAEAHRSLTLDHYQAMNVADRQRMVMEARGQINGAVRDGHISEERASQLIGSLNAKRDRSLPGMLGSYRYEPTEVPATLQHETKGLARTAPIVAVKTAQVPLLVHEIPKLERPAPPVAPRREDTLARMRAITDGTHTTAYDRKESHQALDHLERAYATYGRSVGQGSINDASKGVAIAQEIGERRSRSGTGNEGETAYGHALKHLANGDTLSAEPHLKRAEAAHAAATAPKPEPAYTPPHDWQHTEFASTREDFKTPEEYGAFVKQRDALAAHLEAQGHKPYSPKLSDETDAEHNRPWQIIRSGQEAHAKIENAASRAEYHKGQLDNTVVTPAHLALFQQHPHLLDMAREAGTSPLAFAAIVPSSFRGRVHDQAKLDLMNRDIATYNDIVKGGHAQYTTTGKQVASPALHLAARRHNRDLEEAAAGRTPKPEPAAAPAAPKPAPAAPKPAPAAPASGKARPTFGGGPAESAPVARGGDTGTQGTLGKIDPAGGSKARPMFGGAPVEAPMGKASLGGVLDGQIGMGITTEAPGELFGRTEPGRAQVAGFGYTPRGGAPAGGTTARPRPTFGGAPTETATPPTGPKEAMLNKAHQDAQATLDRHLNTSSFDPLAHMQRTAELKATVDRLAGQLGDIRGTSARSKVQPGDTVKIGGRDHVVTAVAGDRITTNRGTHDRSAITDVVAKTASMFVESRRFSGAAGGGHWLTIEEDGVETHIFLGGGGAGGGVVTKGPAHLIGAHIGHLPPLPGRVLTHHPVGHEPAGAKDHPHYTEHVPPERKPGKPFAREHGAAQTRQAQGPESIPHNQLEARYRAARDAKAKAMGKTEAAPASVDRGGKTEAAPAPTDRGGKTEAAPHEAPTHEHYPILSAHAAGTIDQLHARLAGHLDGDPNVNYPAGMASAMLSKAGQAEHARLVNAVNEGHVPYGGAHDQLLRATGDSHAVAAHDDHLAKLGGLDNINHNVPHIDALIAKHVDGGSLQTDSGRTSGRIETPEEARAVRVPTLDALQAHKAELQAKLDNGKGGADTYHSIQDVNAQIEKHYPAANRPASDAPLAAQADYHGRVAAAHATALSAHDANGTDPTATYAAIERHGNSLSPDHQEAYSAALSAAQDHIDAHGAGHDGTRAMASHAAQEALTGKHDGPLSQDETQALAHRAAAAALGREYTMRTGLAHPDVHLTHEQNLDTIKRRSGRAYYEAAHTAATEAATRANFVDDPNHVARVYNAASMAGHGSGARIEPGVAAHQIDTLHGTNSDAAQAIGRHAASNAIAVHDHQFHDPSLESHFDAHNTAAATDPNTEHFLATELRSGEAKAAYTRAYNAVQAHLAEHLKAGDRAVDHARPLYKVGESEAANHLYRDARTAKRADPNYKAPVRKARAEAEPVGPIVDHGFTYPDHHQANAADAGEIARRASASAQLQANGDRHGDALHATHLANYGGAHRAAYLEAHQAATEYTGRMGRRGGQLTDTQRDIRGRKAEDAARRVLGGYAQIAATEADMQDYSEPTTGDVHQDGPMGGEAPAGGTGAKHMLSRLMARIKGSMGKGYLTAEEYDQHARHALGHAGGMASAVARAAGEGDPYRYDEGDGGSGDMDAGGSDDGDDTPQAGAGMGRLCANCTRHREGDCICAGCAANDGSECACEHIRQTERQDVRMAEASGLTSGGGERFRLFMPVSMAEAPDWIPYLPKPGTFRHPRYGEVAISADRNRDFVQKFNQGVYQHQIPLDAEHETKLSGAMGWINQLRTNEDGSADARVAWTDRGRSMLDQQRFKFISPEWYDKWVDPATGKTISNVAIGGALTTRPYFKAGSLRPLVASEIGRYYLPDEMTTDLDSRLEEDSMQFAEMETEMQRFREESESYRALAEQNAADALRANERVAALESVARRQRFSEEAAGFIGAGVPEHVAFMETLDDSQREFYGRNQRAIAEQAKTSGLYTEIGVTGSTANNTAEAELAGKARSFREANPAMSAAKAMEAALKADPQLYARYNRESAN